MGSKRIKNGKQDRQQKDNDLTISGYVITNKPIKDKDFKKLPPKVQDRIDDLFDIVHRKPRESISKLEDLIRKYPHVPQFCNFLQVAYLNIGDINKAESLVIESYKKHPKYLFSKINYAELCFRKGDFEKIPIIFEGKFDLKMLYPGKKLFHISEFVNFMGFMGIYFCKIGKQQAAEGYYKVLKQISPRHPATKRLKRALYPPLFLRVLQRLAGKTKTPT